LGDPCGGSNFVSVSSIFVGLGTGVGVAVGFGAVVGVGVDVGAVVGVGGGVNVGLGAGATLGVGAGGVGDAAGNGEVSFCPEGALLGVAGFAAFDGIGVGDLWAPDGEDFDFGVGVRLGAGVCAVRSTPR
jgi:hypothetical protein